MFNLGNFSPVHNLERRDISAVENVLLDENGKLKVVSYELLKEFDQTLISQFCAAYGFYNIVTTELVDFLRKEIGSTALDKVIEIASGNGLMAGVLGIKATDNFMQEREDVKAGYELYGQTIVPYGTNVEKIDGNDAIRKYKPEIVIAAWCTHKYNPREHWRGGNAYGVNEKLITERVNKYIHIGNIETHKHKPLLAKKHRSVQAEWLVSRSMHKNKNIIYIWE